MKTDSVKVETKEKVAKDKAAKDKAEKAARQALDAAKAAKRAAASANSGSDVASTAPPSKRPALKAAAAAAAPTAATSATDAKSTTSNIEITPQPDTKRSSIQSRSGKTEQTSQSLMNSILDLKFPKTNKTGNDAIDADREQKRMKNKLERLIQKYITNNKTLSSTSNEDKELLKKKIFKKPPGQREGEEKICTIIYN